MRLAVDGDLPLLHRLEQRGLCLGARAVDLVSKQDLGKHRPGPELEIVELLVEGAHAGHVRRKQVRGELDAPERAVERTGERFGEHRLADPGHVFDQEVTFAEQGDQAKPDLVFLVDDGAADVGDERIGDASYDFGCPHSRDYRFVTRAPHRCSIRSQGTFGSALRYKPRVHNVSYRWSA